LGFEVAQGVYGCRWRHYRKELVDGVD
jgi:hypothetical protein